ncbi:MAG: hypothetical protein ABMA00_16440, partial [Gemmatimonas sp.]
MDEFTESSPVLTVVVPSVNGLHDLIPCCLALAAVRERIALEVLVVDRLGGDVEVAIRARFPWIRVHPMARDATIPQMRDAAFRLARAEAIAVIEDHVIVPPEWGGRLL